MRRASGGDLPTPEVYRREMTAAKIASEFNIAPDRIRDLVGRSDARAGGARNMPLRSTRIDYLMRSGELSSYAGWALRKAGLADLRDLSAWPKEQLHLVHRLGRKGLSEVERAMAAHGVRFGANA